MARIKQALLRAAARVRPAILSAYRNPNTWELVHIAGFLLVAAGVWQVYPPAAYMFLGAGLMGLSFLAMRHFPGDRN